MWRINSVEEITYTTTEEFSDSDDPYSDLPVLSSASNAKKVPFPEAGIDFINVDICDEDISEDTQQESGVKWIDLNNWEENWLFKKRKKCETTSDLMMGYMAMVLAELPVSMLIPNPIDKIRASVGDKEVDELSELSEHNSFGSLEFSDDESEYESDVQNEPQINGKTEELKNHLNDEINAKESVATIVKTVNDANNELMGTEVIKSKVVGNSNNSNNNSNKSNKNKPNVKLIAKVPNYLPKELRNNETCAKSDPYLVLMPGDACVQSGILVQFCCRAKGTKPLLFSWFKNDTILKSDENFRIFQSGEENVLEIKKTSPDFSAQYSCVVYNSCGYHWCDFTLKVEEFNFNNMSANQRHLKPKNSIKPKGVSTNNPKHEKYKYRPLVVQRTWADRVAELQINKYAEYTAQSLKSQTIDETNEMLSDKENHRDDRLLQTCPVSGSFAEREHKKWENPEVEWKDNPYSIENLNSRIQRRAEASSDDDSPEVEEKNEEEEGVDNSFMSSKSKDMTRYKKDYYVKQTPQTNGDKVIKEETLRSFDENEYSNSKYFDVNPTKRKLSEETSQISEISLDMKSSNETESEAILSDSDVILPSVKDLVNKFASNEDKVDTTPKLVDIKRKNSFSDTKLNHMTRNMCQTTQPNFKVHSLTARSLTKEFRQMSHLNLPRSQRNRMAINGQNPINVLIESESSDCSPTTTCSPTNEGYASDESNASSHNSAMSGPPVPPPVMSSKTNGERTFSRSILRRASYWEKRCEQGLISDSSVNEDFPPMEKFAN